MAVDSNGKIFIGGSFYSTADFDPGAGISSLTSVNGSDIYLLKLDGAGNFVWVAPFEGPGGVWPDSMVLTDDGAGGSRGHRTP